MKNKKSLHYVAHTHWDKEWYKTYEEFRIKFIKYFRDILCVLENDKEFDCFMFDGQSSIVDDYLQLFPNEHERIKKLVTNKKLIIGPWYTLPDNYLTSGESLSRNLLIGYNMAKDLGHSQDVCYIPDSFGQSDAMPQIIKELDLKGAILWRGVDSTQTNNAAFKWKGSSNDEVFVVHLSLGYGYSKQIPEDGTHYEYINEIYKMLEQKYKDNVVLFMGGSDHQPLQKKAPELIKDINKKWKKDNFNAELKISTLDDFYDEIKTKVNHDELTTLVGELRSVRDQRVHFGDASGRADLKKMNRYIEYKLAKIVEPIMTLDKVLFNDVYEKELINYAWKLLFANQAHDSACATCTDEAHEDMKNRFLRANQIADELINYANKNILSKIKINDELGEPFIMYNTTSNNQKFCSDIIVYSQNKNFELLDSYSNKINYKLLNQELVNKNFENVDFCNYVSMMSFGDDFKQTNKGQKFDKNNIPVYKNIIKIDNDVIPNLGYKIIYLKNINDKEIIKTSESTYKNIFNKFKVEKNGTVTFSKDKIIFKNIGYLESRGEAGDSYDYSPPEQDKIFNTLNESPKIKVIKSTKDICKVEVKYNWKLPESLISNDSKRSDILIENPVTVIYSFFENQDWFDVEINIENKSIDHVVSINFDSVLTNKNYAGQQFGTIKRTNELTNDEDWEKTSRSFNYAQYPFQEFVSNFDENKGLGIVTLGSSEYKIEDNKTIRVVLFRSFGFMGKSNLVHRPGRPSGIYWKTNKSYMLGENKIKLTVVPFEGEKEYGNFIQIKDSILNPIQSYEVIRDVFYKQIEEFDSEKNNFFIKINNEKVTLSCVKKCEYEDAYIIRMFNSTLETIKNIEIEPNKKCKALLSNIKERDIKLLDIVNNKIVIPELLPNKILNIKIKF